MQDLPHIAVCICTYKRPEMLARLLDKLKAQDTDHLFSYSVVVVDNDDGAAAKGIVEAFVEKAKVAVRYDVEPERGFAKVRNRAVANAEGDFIAFIDDDEFPDTQWLLRHYMALKVYKADGVLGPVIPHFDIEPPQWVVRSRICERETFPTGTVMRNHGHTRMGNALLARTLFDGVEAPFDVRYGSMGGEDTNFFKCMMEKGKTFVWCNEAPVWETVPRERLSKRYFLKRGLLRGYLEANDTGVLSYSVLKSFVASAIYTIAMPLLFIMGPSVYMKYLIKDCDHIGKLLGVCGVPLFKQRAF